MWYDRGDRFWTKWKIHLVQKLSPRSYPIHCERKWKYSFLSVNSLKNKSKFTLIEFNSVESVECIQLAKKTHKYINSLNQLNICKTFRKIQICKAATKKFVEWCWALEFFKLHNACYFLLLMLNHRMLFSFVDAKPSHVIFFC